jgi:hypothetical protein
MGNRWLDLEMGNGEELNIPVSAIFTYESLSTGKSEDSPEARSFVRYDYGLGPMQAALNTDFSEVERQIQKHRKSDFVKLNQEDDTVLYLPHAYVRGLVGVPENESEGSTARCAVACQIGGAVINFRVQETPKQIRILMGESGAQEGGATKAARPPRTRK